MIRTGFWILVWVVAASVSVARANDVLRIGYVNLARVIEEAPQGEAALKKLETEFGPRDRRITEMQQRLKLLEEELEKNALVMKDTDRRTRDHEVTGLRRDLRRETQEFREDYNLRRNEELSSLQKLAQKAIQEVGREGAYDLVIHEGTVFASPRVDITDKVLRRLGKK